MRIGIIGAGQIGGTLAVLFIDAGHEVALSNSRGPETLAGLVDELGGRAQASTVAETARFGDVIVVAVPFGRYCELPTEGVAGKVVIDANYDPQRDGHFEELDSGRATSSELLQAHLPGARAWSRPSTRSSGRACATKGRPAGDPDRLGIPLSGDDEQAKRIVAELIDQIGFDPVDAGTLAEGRAKASNRRIGLHPGLAHRGVARPPHRLSRTPGQAAEHMGHGAKPNPHTTGIEE
jgi:predicted dinucleotide-binding enzyme